MESQSEIFFTALASGDLNQVQQLMEDNPELIYSRNGWSGCTPLQIACSNGSLDITKFLLSKGANVDVMNEIHSTPLHFACCHGHLDVAMVLLSTGVRINVKNKYGITPLHVACSNDFFAIVELLVASGADPTIQNKYNETAYDVAKTDEIRRILRDAMQIAECVSASARGDITAVERLLRDAPYVINGMNYEGRTPLMSASAAGQVDMVRLLLKRGADASSKNRDDCDALVLSAKDEISNMLLDVLEPSRRRWDVCRFLSFEVLLRTSQASNDRDAAVTVISDIHDLQSAFPHINRCIPEDIVQILQSEHVDIDKLRRHASEAVKNCIRHFEAEVDECLRNRDAVQARCWNSLLLEANDLRHKIESLRGSDYINSDNINDLNVVTSYDIFVDDSARISSSVYSSVYRGTFRGTDVAIKMIRGDGGMHTIARDLQQTEIELLSSLRHPRILTLMGVVLDLDPRYGALCGLVTEYMTRGSLYSVLHMVDTHHEHRLTSLSLKLRVLRDVAEGMRFLHRSNVIHRDLKSLNVLLDEEGGAKICDFGISKILSMDMTHASTAVIGTPAWSSPEALLGDAGGIRQSSDVYSFGVILWEMLTNAIPWSGLTVMQLSVCISRGEALPIPVASEEDAPHELIDTLERCLNRIPDDRPTFEYIYEVIKRLLTTCRDPCPAEYRCPISLEIMEDPVICSDGQTYERANIERWLRDHDTSPKTNAELQHRNLTPNIALRCVIQDFLERML